MVDEVEVQGFGCRLMVDEVEFQGFGFRSMVDEVEVRGWSASEAGRSVLGVCSLAFRGLKS
jgi:hypothetical protein